MKMRTTIIILMSIWLVQPVTTFGADAENALHDDPFSYNINTLLIGLVQHPAHSTQNPDNVFLDLYEYSADVQVRPDLYWEQPAISALFKPRFSSSWYRWRDGASRGTTDTLSRAFVNEWRIQIKPVSELFVSYGKEKLLWGPSFLASPSNILFRDTEKANPKSEVEGKPLARMVYVPNDVYTVSLIAETERETTWQGENLKPLQVLKAEVMGGNYLASMIGYHRPGDRARAGSFGQWTATDALVLYYDGIVTRGTDVLYPVSNPSAPLGGVFDAKYNHADRLFTTITAGGSYTFLSGSTFWMEFLYNEAGYRNAEAEEYYALRKIAHDHYFESGPLSGLAQMTLAASLNNGSAFLRRYYLMGQYQLRELRNAVDIFVRYVHGIEEHVGQASTIVEWKITDRVQFFNINSIALGNGQENEFRALVDKSFLAGIEMHY